MRVVVGINVLGGGSLVTARRSKPKSGADDQLHCVGESRITSHNIATFRRPTDSMKDSKQGELIEEESRLVESQILPPAVPLFILKDEAQRIRAAGLKEESTTPNNSLAVEI